MIAMNARFVSNIVIESWLCSSRFEMIKAAPVYNVLSLVLKLQIAKKIWPNLISVSINLVWFWGQMQVEYVGGNT